MNDHYKLKPIETVYQNYKFRSRLEARWAVFFNALDISWTYEPQGFHLPSGPYLPDFHLTDDDWDCFVEIKPETILKTSLKREPSPDADKTARLCHELSLATNRPVLLISGPPGIKDYHETYEVYIFVPDFVLEQFDTRSSPNGIVFGALGLTYYSPITEDFFCSSARLYGFIHQQYHDHPEWFREPMPQRGDVQALIAADKIYYQKRYGKEHWAWHYGLCGGNYYFEWLGDTPRLGHRHIYSEQNPVADALIAGQQARFEYGQNG